MIATLTAAQLAKFEELKELQNQAKDALVLMRSAKAGITYDTARKAREQLVEDVADLVLAMPVADLEIYVEWRRAG